MSTKRELIADLAIENHKLKQSLERFQDTAIRGRIETLEFQLERLRAAAAELLKFNVNDTVGRFGIDGCTQRKAAFIVETLDLGERYNFTIDQVKAVLSDAAKLIRLMPKDQQFDDETTRRKAVEFAEQCLKESRDELEEELVTLKPFRKGWAPDNTVMGPVQPMNIPTEFPKPDPNYFDEKAFWEAVKTNPNADPNDFYTNRPKPAE